MTTGCMQRAARGAFALALSLLTLTALVATPASAASGWWHLMSSSVPSQLAPGGEGTLTIAATNFGEAAISGTPTPVTLSETLPVGLTATAISATAGAVANDGPVECELAALTCRYEGTLPPYERIEVKIAVRVAPDAAAGGEAQTRVLGGGVAPATASKTIAIGFGAPFGVESYELLPEAQGGLPDTQAGSHPFALTTTLALDQGAELLKPPALVKDLHFQLPPGLVGNPTPFPQCTGKQFTKAKSLGVDYCPSNTAVGVAAITFQTGALGPNVFTLPVPVFNLVPRVGEPARFGFYVVGSPVTLDTEVRTGGDYGVTVNVDDITQTADLIASQVTLWGVPGDPRHDLARGWCVLSILSGESCTAGPQPTSAPPPLITLPTSCTTPFETSVTADSWAQPQALTAPVSYSLHDGLGRPLALDGCNRLDFEPSISVAPDGSNASTPTGLTVGVHVPQTASLDPTGLAESTVKDTTVTLPEGVQVSPAGADGLQACSPAQIGLVLDAQSTCPDAAKVGTLEIRTPLLPNPLLGEAYLAAQNENPFGSLVALYLVAEDPLSGVLVKLAGKVTLDSNTGQLVSTFENTPQLPFEDLKLHFFGSARAPLSTPPMCGSYTTRAAIAPWSGNAPAEPSSTFQITSGPNGAPCANPRPFAPGFQAGSTNLQAGAFTPFTLTMSRPDADQTLAGLSVQLPPGLSGDVSSVQLCPEPQASEGACPAGSLIGHTVVSAGLGNAPFTVEGGEVFITGPYKGAPFGLSILNPAKAGPFDLGHVVVRAKVEVDPTTAALHVVSDPLPTILDGIPLQIQHVNVTVDRSQFTFNPTDCDPTSLTGTMSSTEGASAAVSTPFQVTNCASLKFKPGFSVSTSGKPSRANGESLDVKLTYPNAPRGSQANIAKVRVELPKQLPSRLSTLQKACTETTFDSSPDACPATSRVGEAVATTPILSGVLAGPAYFVSHGGAKFPELIVVLKGEDGVTVDLHGETFISRKGITSSTFNTVPDVPVGSFELKLPQGPYSALAANGNPCKQKLAMPTTFTAQNGAVIHQQTKINVTGCPKAKHVKHRKKTRRKPPRGVRRK